jgi:hypothetical protein
VLLARADDKVLGLLQLEHHPHGLDVVLGMAPIALGVEVAEEDGLLLTLGDARHGSGDLTRHKGGAYNQTRKGNKRDKKERLLHRGGRNVWGIPRLGLS